MQQYRKVLLEEIRSYSPVPDERWSREKWHSGPGPYKKGYANSDVIGIIHFVSCIRTIQIYPPNSLRLPVLLILILVPGTIDYLHSFDNNFFNISPKEMAIMDKQQFRIMEVGLVYKILYMIIYMYTKFS